MEIKVKPRTAKLLGFFTFCILIAVCLGVFGFLYQDNRIGTTSQEESSNSKPEIIPAPKEDGDSAKKIEEDTPPNGDDTIDDVPNAPPEQQVPVKPTTPPPTVIETCTTEERSLLEADVIELNASIAALQQEKEANSYDSCLNYCEQERDDAVANCPLGLGSEAYVDCVNQATHEESNCRTFCADQSVSYNQDIGFLEQLLADVQKDLADCK